jgi:MoaA/NifB/PqqE/SkfB family radical SAM enzyme
MFSTNSLQALKKAWEIRKYPTAGRNAHPARIALNALPYYASWTGWALPPLSVFIHVNTACNLRCKMCDAGQEAVESTFYKNLKGNHPGDMPLESFKAIVNKVASFKPFIGIPVLEPLLYPHIEAAVAHVHERGMPISLATNATMLEDRADALVTAGLDRIVVSLDGTREIHDRIRGVAGVYDKVLLGLRVLAESKRRHGSRTPYVFINYVISEDNQGVIRDFADGLPLDLVDQVDFRVMFYCTQQLADAHNERFGEELLATEACLAGGIDLAKVDTDLVHAQMDDVLARHAKCKFFFNHGREGLRTYYHDGATFLDSTNCVWPWYTMQVSNDATVIPFQRCFNDDYGNILTQDFQAIWNGPRLRRMRKLLRTHGRFPACARCEGVNF